ncbi:hypothetical protein V1512DRAFT_286671 [Lipomyces arxii]|uniref:uncharacterized protein n=1 Tax=Lipomyces arxii TaxID=56418 RepID=UPI0034CE8090
MSPQLPSSDPPKRKRGRPPRNGPKASFYLPPDLQPPKKEDLQVAVNEEEAAIDEVDYDNEDDEDDDDNDDDEEEEDDDDDEEYNGSRRRKVRRKSGRVSRKRHTSTAEPDEDDESAVGRRKRGRPPTVDKPHEDRIKAIMRALRKAKIGSRVLFLPFERMLDIKEYPDYFQEIKEPIALDIIKKRIKQRQYATVEAFMRDVNLMFDNAKQYNEPGSLIYRDTVALQKVVQGVCADELSKPDSAYQDPESSSSKHARLPLDGIEHRGEIYRVGDWVHIVNLNDPSRPTIGQIFRTWQSPGGGRWINACWYYRPEQTVHNVDKLFYENEVVKSGQYRDHLIDEVIEKCFVMFFTKYKRGRPVGIGNRMVYCCESRYNENEKTFNKIRTWKACIPDEARSVDYEMDLFDRLQPLRKVPSPIKHLLPEDARDDDPIPESKIGVDNAPPIVGAVYKRPLDPNAPIEGKRQCSVAPCAPNLLPDYTNHSSTQLSIHARPANNHTMYNFSRPGISGSSGSGSGSSNVRSAQMYNPPPPPSTFTLPDYITDRIPPETADLYQKDDNGKLLWFSVPPIDAMRVAANGITSGVTGHTVEFLAHRKEIAEKRKRREHERELLFNYRKNEA